MYEGIINNLHNISNKVTWNISFHFKIFSIVGRFLKLRYLQTVIWAKYECSYSLQMFTKIFKNESWKAQRYLN